MSIQTAADMLLNLRKRSQRSFDTLLRDKVQNACTDKNTGVVQVNDNGDLIRGVVSAIKCSCGVTRWSDGTRCINCKLYPSSFVGAEDDGRL